MQQPVNAPTIFTVCQTPTPKRYPINEKVVLGLGVSIVVFGVFCIGLQLAGILANIGLADAGTGIWCGLWFILNGAFGIAAAKNQSLCTIVTFMVLSIISAVVFVVTQLTIVAIGLSIDDYDSRYGCGGWDYVYSRSCDDAEAGVGINSTLVVLSVVIGILTILGSAYSCGALCCKRSTSSPRVISPQVVTTTSPYVQQTSSSRVVVLVPSQTYPGHYTIAQNQHVVQAPIAQQFPQMAQLPPSYDNFAYRNPQTEIPAVHLPAAAQQPAAVQQPGAGYQQAAAPPTENKVHPN